MHVISIYSSQGPQNNLDYIFSIFKSTLEELGVNISVVNINSINIPFFDGKPINSIKSIINNIASSDAIIFAATAHKFSVNASMQALLEHFDTSLYGDFFNGKHSISIITSSDNSQYFASNYFNLFLSSLNSIPSSMPVGLPYLNNLNSPDFIKTVERYAEDFYRAVKQNKQFFISNPLVSTGLQRSNLNNFNNSQNSETINFNNKKVVSLSGNQVANLYQKDIDSNLYSSPNTNMNNMNTINSNFSTVSNISTTSADNPFLANEKKSNNRAFNSQASFNSTVNSNNFSQDKHSQVISDFSNHTNSNKIQEFNSFQEEDISEITKLLTKRYNEHLKDNTSFTSNTSANFNKQDITPSISTLKQKTQMLYHYFQPHMANDIFLSIQLVISGKEQFEGYFLINNGDCTYNDGSIQNPDVSVFSPSDVWAEVLNGKTTLQKAFMLGRLKVKGNFIMISKFEQFFKILN